MYVYMHLHSSKLPSNSLYLCLMHSHISQKASKIMKVSASGHCRFLVFVVLVLAFTSAASANAFFAPKSRTGDQRVKVNEIHPAKEEDFSNLMGMETEECKKEDEECMGRRMVDEAHLDYIYTQKHHHP